VAIVYEVEGLVGRFPRGGSSPLGRMGIGWKSRVSARAGAWSRQHQGGSWQRFGNADVGVAGLSFMSVMTPGYDQRPATCPGSRSESTVASDGSSSLAHASSRPAPSRFTRRESEESLRTLLFFGARKWRSRVAARSAEPGSGDQDRGSQGERMLGRPILGRWAC
jgi:hypothetical protein